MHPDFQILLMVDNADDAKVIGRTLRDSNIQHRLTVIHDGRDALESLRGLPKPDLILLDLNLPGVDGGQILTEIKNDPGLRTVPVVVLPADQAGADTSIQKPAGFPKYRDLVLTLRAFWHETAARSPRDQAED